MRPSLLKPLFKCIDELISKAVLSTVIRSIQCWDAFTAIIVPNQHTIVYVLALSQLPHVNSAGGEDDLKHSIQSFDGVVSSFTPWLIAFTALIAWKKPQVCALLNGTSPRPTVADPNNPTVAERKRLKAWNLLNVQLYGALVSYVVPTIQASLHVNSLHDGVAALKYLQTRYGSQSKGDRAEATARLQRTHIDARAKISAEDVTSQYNEMALAAADIVASNGTRPDDSLMISMFENALPPSYGPIRQMMRYAQHTTFDGYYNDLLTQVKAELRSADFHSVGAFTTTHGKGKVGKVGKGAQGSKGKGKGKGGGSKGRWQPGRAGAWWQRRRKLLRQLLVVVSKSLFQLPGYGSHARRVSKSSDQMYSSWLEPCF